MKGRIFAIFAAALMAGCAATTTTRVKLQDEWWKARAGHRWDFCYYCGSKEGFDYFDVDSLHLIWWTGRMQRIPASEGAVKEKLRFPYTDNKEKWRHYHPWGGE